MKEKKRVSPGFEPWGWMLGVNTVRDRRDMGGVGEMWKGIEERDVADLTPKGTRMTESENTQPRQPRFK